jgi:hypothetical protein
MNVSIFKSPFSTPLITPRRNPAKNNTLETMLPLHFSGLHPREKLIRELQALRKQLLGVAGKPFAYDPSAYEARKHICPLTSQCGPVTYIVQQKYGGEIISAPIKFEWQGKQFRETHYWNRIDGQEYDLSGSQYGGDGIHALDSPEQIKLTSGKPADIKVIKVGNRKVVPGRKSINPRFEKMAALLQD